MNVNIPEVSEVKFSSTLSVCYILEGTCLCRPFSHGTATLPDSGILDGHPPDLIVTLLFELEEEATFPLETPLQ